mmetsp:Transcript_41297/g.54281  ORF Transcript_41297/g.54281 Transcript_41297/m.54281 type:complete len:252 (-) Transcript_41297:475-1230(-)
MASCSSVTFSSAMALSMRAVSFANGFSISSGPRFGGTALVALTDFGFLLFFAGFNSPASRVCSGFSVGSASVAAAIFPAVASVSFLTLPMFASLTSSISLLFSKSSASSLFLGSFISSMRVITSALKLAASNSFGSCASISSTCSAIAKLPDSLAGDSAASKAFSPRAFGLSLGFFFCFWLSFLMFPITNWKFGSSFGFGFFFSFFSSLAFFLSSFFFAFSAFLVAFAAAFTSSFSIFVSVFAAFRSARAS